MDKITDNDSMKSIVEENSEIVIHGAGNMGQAIIKNIIERGWRNRIACCAVKNSSENRKEIMGVPVLEIKCMPHFWKTACFIIAVAENRQDEIYDELVQIGCVHIKVVKYSYALELERAQNGANSQRPILDILKAEIYFLSKKMEDLQYQVAEQNEICAVNVKAFKNFENCNYGKDAVIVGAGPSLKYYTPKADAVHVGVNFTWKRKDIPFDYFFLQDGNRRYAYREMFEGVLQNVSSHIFIGRFSKRCIYKEIEFPVVSGQEGERIHRYWLEPDHLKEPCQNICYHPLADYCSVIFAALQFVLYTYPKKIYLVGCDTSYKGHFYDDHSPQEQNFLQNIWKYGYIKFKEFAEQYYPETEIISVNPVGLKGLFRDEYTEEFLKENISCC